MKKIPHAIETAIKHGPLSLSHVMCFDANDTYRLA